VSHRFLVDISLPLARFTLAIRWETGESALGIFGPSGAGKTSVLESLAGLRRGTRGIIQVDGRVWLDALRGVRLPPEERGVGYVPQDALLFPHRDVMGNVLAGRRRAGRRPARRLDPARVLDVLELQPLQGREVASLSGGERQRVALARALCSAPDLLLLDEPLAGLDLPLRRRILPYLYRVREEFAIPTLHVSHDATEIQTLCREVLVLNAGREVARGRPETVFPDAAVLPLARAEGYENVLRGTIAEAAGGSGVVDLEPGLRLTVAAAGLTPGREAVIGVRAEDLILAVEPPTGLSAQNILAGAIDAIREEAGTDGAATTLLVVVALGRRRTPLVVAITPRARERLALRPGLAVHLVCKAQACRVLATR